MDPITAAIVAALAAGAAGGAGEVGKRVIVDAYGAVKAALKRKFGADSNLASAVETLEGKPDSAARQAMLGEEVADARANDDTELKKLVQALIDALKSTPEGEKAVAKYLVDARGAQIGVLGDDADVEGGIHFEKTKP